MELRPQIEEVLAALTEVGAGHAMVTGSGPTAFGLFPDDEAAEEAAAALRAAGRSRSRPAPLRWGRMSGSRIDRKWLLRGGIALLVVAFLVFRDALPEFDLEKIIEDLSAGLGSWTYLLVALLAFLETGAFVGLIAPGEFTVLLGGAVAGQGDISLPVILGITWLSAFCGDSVSFVLGARLGRGFLVRHGERVRITEERLAQVEEYFARHGGKTILIGRFIGLVRALAPFIAGTSKMPYSSFAPYSVLGTGLWALTFILIGYFASQSLDTVAEIVGRGRSGSASSSALWSRCSSGSGGCGCRRTGTGSRPRWSAGQRCGRSSPWRAGCARRPCSSGGA